MTGQRREIRVGDTWCYLDEDEILHIVSHGDIDEETFEKISAATVEVSRAVMGKVNVLVDLNRCGKLPFRVLKSAKRDFEKERTGRVALFGMAPMARILASFLIGIIGKKDISFFKREAEARAWLKGAVHEDRPGRGNNGDKGVG